MVKAPTVRYVVQLAAPIKNERADVEAAVEAMGYTGLTLGVQPDQCWFQSTLLERTSMELHAMLINNWRIIESPTSKTRFAGNPRLKALSIDLVGSVLRKSTLSLACSCHTVRAVGDA